MKIGTEGKHHLQQIYGITFTKNLLNSNFRFLNVSFTFLSCIYKNGFVLTGTVYPQINQFKFREAWISYLAGKESGIPSGPLSADIDVNLPKNVNPTYAPSSSSVRRRWLSLLKLAFWSGEWKTTIVFGKSLLN